MTFELIRHEHEHAGKQANVFGLERERKHSFFLTLFTYAWLITQLSVCLTSLSCVLHKTRNFTARNFRLVVINFGVSMVNSSNWTESAELE